MLLFSPNWLFLYPGALMTALGLTIGFVLLSQPIFLDSVRFGLDTLIYCSTLVAVGVQAMLFAVLSRAYAVQEGLYPKKAGYDDHADKITLERGLIAGLILLLAGLATGLYAFFVWKQNAFGMMETEQMARLVIPSSLTISLGFEIILFSFLLSTFGLNAPSYPTMIEQMEKKRVREISKVLYARH
jgi:hypothetical protein